MSEQVPDTTPIAAAQTAATPTAAEPKAPEEKPIPMVMKRPHPERGGERSMDLVCPFDAEGRFCVYPMSPRKPQPTPREYKLLKIMGLPAQQDTKVGCVRCTVFRETWKKRAGLGAEIRFLFQRLAEGGKDLFRSNGHPDSRGKRAA